MNQSNSGCKYNGQNVGWWDYSNKETVSPHNTNTA